MHSRTTLPAQAGDAVLMDMAPLTHAAQMYISAALILDGEAPGADEVAGHIAPRVRRVPGLRHRYAEAVGRARWQPQRVCADDHVALLTLDGDAAGAGVDALMEQVRRRPPVSPAGAPMWDVLIATGFTPGRWALVFRCHHTQMDGMAITHTLDQLFGTAPPARRRPLLSGALKPGLRHLPSAAASIIQAARPTAPWPAPAAAVGEGTATYAVTEPVGVDDIKQPGATLTQVLAACFALAADSWWPLPGDRQVHVVVPMDLREPGEQRTMGNHFAPLRLALPTGDPDRVLHETGTQMTTWRRPGLRAALDLVIRRMTPFPAALVLGERISAGTGCRAVVSSVRSRRPLSFHGSPVLDLVPAAPTFPGHALSCLLWSYEGRARIAFGSHTGMPGVGALPQAWEQALKSMRASQPFPLG
ncbi:WS/DGAT domain-containing protein [Streptomyces atroolivaceus]|uniref:diacylglycerol O-acyltransferase n=1 Tax=Streptomyces atroolivaceus TaxID=66869 RepID=A0ABV9VGU3_STRAZ|nr:WS/DGAT domain-containing protein [Streptomyces atroolivaceus]